MADVAGMGTALIVIAWGVGALVFLRVCWWVLRNGGADSSWFKGGGAGSL
jgi:hypothetical protein